MMTIGELWHAAWSAGRVQGAERGDDKVTRWQGDKVRKAASASGGEQRSAPIPERAPFTDPCSHLVTLSPCHLVSVIDGVKFASLTIVGVGTCEVRLQGMCAEMRGLFVVPDHRRRGVGQALFREALRVASEGGKASLCWTVRKENTDALRFYRRMGADIFRDDFDDYWMAVICAQRQQHSTPISESVRVTDPRSHLVTHSPIHPLSSP